MTKRCPDCGMLIVPGESNCTCDDVSRPFAGLVAAVVLIVSFAACVAAVWFVNAWFGWWWGALLAVVMVASVVWWACRLPGQPEE